MRLYKLRKENKNDSYRVLSVMNVWVNHFKGAYAKEFVGTEI